MSSSKSFVTVAAMLLTGFPHVSADETGDFLVASDVREEIPSKEAAGSEGRSLFDRNVISDYPCETDTFTSRTCWLATEFSAPEEELARYIHSECDRIDELVDKKNAPSTSKGTPPLVPRGSYAIATKQFTELVCNIYRKRPNGELKREVGFECVSQNPDHSQRHSPDQCEEDIFTYRTCWLSKIAVDDEKFSEYMLYVRSECTRIAPSNQASRRALISGISAKQFRQVVCFYASSKDDAGLASEIANECDQRQL